MSRASYLTKAAALRSAYLSIRPAERIATRMDCRPWAYCLSRPERHIPTRLSRRRLYSGRITRTGLPVLIFLLRRTFPREQYHHVLQGAQVAVSPVPTLFASFGQMLLFLKALRCSMGNPLFKFSATTFYFAKFYALICHSDLDARLLANVSICPAAHPCSRFLRC